MRFLAARRKRRPVLNLRDFIKGPYKWTMNRLRVCRIPFGNFAAERTLSGRRGTPVVGAALVVIARSCIGRSDVAPSRRCAPIRPSSNRTHPVHFHMDALFRVARSSPRREIPLTFSLFDEDRK